MSKDLYFVFGLEPEICLNLLNDDHYLGCQKYILKKLWGSSKHMKALPYGD
jgi:hypothetical protein